VVRAPDDQSPTSNVSRGPWSKQQIQAARRVPLAPLLPGRGWHLRTLTDGNFLVQEMQDLVIKEHYWIWNSARRQGNAIDFLVMIEGLTFDQAMRVLADQLPNPSDEE
jgi:hypothetical protein